MPHKAEDGPLKEGQPLERITGREFLREVEECANNVRMQNDPEHAPHAEQLSYEFDKIIIHFHGVRPLTFDSPAYTLSEDGNMVHIGKRGHGMANAKYLDKVGGSIENSQSFYRNALEDPFTRIEVKRRQKPRSTW